MFVIMERLYAHPVYYLPLLFFVCRTKMCNKTFTPLKIMLMKEDTKPAVQMTQQMSQPDKED
jgi:hypothetical protein